MQVLQMSAMEVRSDWADEWPMTERLRLISTVARANAACIGNKRGVNLIGRWKCRIIGDLISSNIL